MDVGASGRTFPGFRAPLTPAPPAAQHAPMPTKPREPKPPIDSPLATAAEVCEFLRISRKTFIRHDVPELDYVEVGARQIWIWESVYDWVDRNAVHRKPKLPALPARREPQFGPKRTREEDARIAELAARLSSRCTPTV